MFAKFKKIYESKTPREKVLIIAVIWIPLIYWLSALHGGQRELSANYTMGKAKEDESRFMISRTKQVEETLKEEMKNFDDSKLVKDLRVELEKILREMQLANYVMSAPDPKPSGRMQIHSVTITLKNTSIDVLAELEKRLIARAPYISMSVVDLTGDNLGHISARYEINSFEFNDKK